MKYLATLIFIISTTYGYSETLDERVTRLKSDENALWMNGMRGTMVAIKDPEKDMETLFSNAFKNISYDEGKPSFTDSKVLETKRFKYNKSVFLFVRFEWKGKERILDIDITKKDEWYVR